MQELNGGKVRWIIEADTTSFDFAVDQSSKKAEQLKDNLNKSEASRGGLFASLTSQSRSAGQAMGDLARSIANVGWGTFSAGATTAVGALSTLIAKGIQGTDALETARTSMAGLTGSMEAGNKALSIAANFWQNNPFDRFTTTNAQKQLIQYGRTLSQTSSDLELLGKISQSTSVPLDEMARYYASTAASGRAMTMDLEMMSDRGIPIYQKLSQITGKTTEQVRKMASESKISFELFQEALEKSVNAEAMAEFENTLARQRDRLSGSISILAGDLAGYKIVNEQLIISEQGLEKAWTRLIKTLATGLRSDKMRESLEKLGYALAQILDKITPLIPALVDKLGSALEFVANHSSTLIPIIGGILTVMGKFGQNLPGIGGIIGSIGNSFNGLKSSIVSLAKANPLLATFIGLFGAGFVSAVKNSEDFRNSLKELGASLGNVFKSLMPVIQTFLNIFVKIVSSKAVIGILQTVVKVLTVLSDVIAGLPTDVLTGLITSLLMFKLMSISNMAGVAGGLLLIVGAVSSLVEEMGGLEGIGQWIGNLWEGLTKGTGKFIKTLGEIGKAIVQALVTPFNKALGFIKGVPSALATVGHNIMTGLVNGLVEGSKKVADFVTGVAKGIVSTFKSILGIHSPSTVMEEQGKFITLGLANGITNNSGIVEKAMDSLASSVLSTAQKVIGNRSEFGLFNYNDEYKAWKKISQLFTKGSQQYEAALERMEEARKNVNLQILKLQNEYNDTLDDTIDHIANMYGLLDEVDLSKNGKNIYQITENLDKQVSKLQEWASAQEAIAELDLDPKFIEELQQMGVDATEELSAIATASAEEIANLNTLWLKKQEIATKSASKQLTGLRNDTLNEISKLKDGIDGETINVVEVGGRLVSSIGDGITGALPTLESSFAQLNDFIAKQIAKSGESESISGSVAEELTEGVTGGINQAMDDIKASISDLGKGMAGIIAGVVAAPILFKVLGKLKLGDKLKSLFNFGKVAQQAKTGKEASEAISEVATGLSKSSETIVKSGSQLTKAQSAMKTMRSGIINIILLAGAIAAMGVALKTAYESIPSDIGGLSAKLVVVAGVVGVMGVLAGLAGKFDASVKKGLQDIAIIAGEVALTALAIAVANALIPNDLGAIIPKMILMGSVIGGMEILAGLAGKFDKKVTEGLKTIAIVAGEIALTGIALGVANALIPDRLDLMIGKLGVMGLAIAEFGALAAVIDLIPVDFQSGLITVAEIAGAIAAVGLALGVADQAIQSNFDVFIGKLGIMGLAVTEFGVLAGIIGALMATPIGWFMGAGLATVLAICGGMVSIALAIGEIDQKVPEDISGVENKIDLMKKAVEAMISANFGNLFENLGKALNIGLIADIADGFKQISETLSLISNIEIDKDSIVGKVDKIKECIEVLSGLQTGDFWNNLKNRDNTSIMTDTVKNIYDIVSKIGECIEILKGLEKMMENSQTITGYVMTIRNIVENLSEIQTGGFWAQLNNAKAIEQVNKAADSIKSIVDKVKDICYVLQELDDNYGKGQAEELVKRAIGIIQQFAGVKLNDGEQGWVSSATVKQVAKDLENVNKTSGYVGEIVKSAKDTFAIIEEMGITEEGAKKLVGDAQIVLDQFSGVTLESGDRGWFEKNAYQRVAEDLERVKNMASAIGDIMKVAKDIGTTIQEFTGGAGGLKESVQKANEIIQAFADIKVEQNWVEDTANKSGNLNTTAGNVSNILVAASTIVENIKKFREQQLDVPTLVKEANGIIQEFAKIEITQEGLDKTSENAGHVGTIAENVDKILGSAKGIVEKIQSFAEITVTAVIGYVGSANLIIEEFSKLNINGSKDYQKLAENASSLNSIVGSSKEIIDKASTLIETIRTFVNNYPGDQLEAEVKSVNTQLGLLAKINVEGLGNGEEKVARLETVKNVVNKVSEIAQAINGVPDTAEKITNVESIIKFIEEKLSTIPSVLQKYDDSFIALGDAYAKKFAEGWKAQYDQGFENGKAMSFKYMEGIASTLQEFTIQGEKVQGAFWSGIESKMADEVAQGSALAGKVLEGLSSQDGEFKTAGQNALQGFINGAQEKNPYSAGWQIADRFLQGIKDRGKQGSPWKTTNESGKWAVLGLLEGIKGNERKLVSEAELLADTLIDALNMEDVSLNPTLDANVNPFVSNLPAVDYNQAYANNNQNGKSVIIEQTNNNYTQYSIEKLNSDLKWELSKV